jgi:esterase/lipase superfamily enzyme
MRREYLKWWSGRLGRDMELLTFGHGGARVVVFPTRCGRFFDYENWGLVDAVRDRIERGWMQLYCVDSVDQESFYCRALHPADRLRRHAAYEAYVMNEVLPLSERQNPGSFLMSHGCSLGAFHAINIALRHPGLFRKAVGFSGRYALTHGVEDFPDLLDGYYDEQAYFHSPLHFLSGAREAQHLGYLRQVEVTIAIGEADPFLDNNVGLSRVLDDKGIPNRLHIWQRRAHCPRSWSQMARLYL